MNWERRIAFFLWSVVGLALGADHFLRYGLGAWSCLAIWGGAFLATGLGFGWIARQTQRNRAKAPWWLWLGLQAGAILFCIAYDYRTNLFGGALLVITAWQAGQVWKLRGALAWCGLQTLALGATVAPFYPDPRWVSGVLILGGLQAFAVLVARMTRMELESRLALAERSSELRELQELLASGGQAAERLRLARELHDGLGHRLTAIALHLEAAQHGQKEALGKAQRMAHDTLTELRHLVSRMRDPEAVHLEATLQALVEQIRHPLIHLDLKGDAAQVEPSVAHALVRCTQEFVTNAIKHAQARNLWLELHFQPEGTRMEVRDDGQGAEALQEGHGLQGMRERLAALGGQLDLDHAPGRFKAVAWIPTP